MANSRHAPLAKFCKNKTCLFSKRQARGKKRFHDCEFATATIREFLQMNFDFFLRVKASRIKKGSFMVEKSRYPPLAKFCNNKTCLLSKRQAQRKQRCVMITDSPWPPFAKFCKK